MASRKLRINAKETMRIAEHLYNQGLISYPRTETNAFPKDFDLCSLIQQQTQDPAWGGNCFESLSCLSVAFVNFYKIVQSFLFMCYLKIASVLLQSSVFLYVMW